MSEADFLIKVSANSRTTAVAGSIAKALRERESVDVQAIGAGAVNQSVKAIAIAQSYLEEDEIEITCMPSFIELTISGQERTAIRMTVRRT